VRSVPISEVSLRREEKKEDALGEEEDSDVRDELESP
jgi:hypothetical protein